MAFGAFDLFEGLDVFVFGPVHNGKNFSYEMAFIARPMTSRASIKWFQRAVSSIRGK